MSKIMVVDDDNALLTILQLTFERAGYEVITAENGPQAVEMALRHQPRLVVLDDMMPAMTGGDVCKRFRETPALAHILILMYSARTDAISAEYLNTIGADAGLRKPTPPQVILETVRSLLAGASV
jgi:two-component system alkaline phosphatase synthesis response regulator PhoP